MICEVLSEAKHLKKSEAPDYDETIDCREIIAQQAESAEALRKALDKVSQLQEKGILPSDPKSSNNGDHAAS
jgi:hypothetical protein